MHLILDNCGSHNSAPAKRWRKPKKRRRFQFHFTPTDSSWLNQLERFFSLITEETARRGMFPSARESEQAIYRWLTSWNGDPAPFVGNASAEVVLDQIRRCKELARTGD